MASKTQDCCDPTEIAQKLKKICEDKAFERDPTSEGSKCQVKGGEGGEKPRRRKTRWHNEYDRVLIPGLPVALSTGDLTAEQQKLYVLQLQIEEISLKLRTGNLGIPIKPEDRSPSPEPVYNTQGVRLNTREIRVRQRLEEERHNLIKIMVEQNPEYKPPPDYKIPSAKLTDKVFIPQEKHPNINFIGLLIGPRGNTLKRLENDTGCKIIIRGKGSLKEGKLRLVPMPGEDEPLHALITAPTEENLAKGIATVKRIIKEGIECPDGDNELRRMQLRELAELNGTLIASEITRCRNCGAADHRHWECTEVRNVTSLIVCSKCGGAGHLASDCTFEGEKVVTAEEKAKIDDEYQCLMKELGVTSQQDTGPMMLGLPKVLVSDLPWASNYSGSYLGANAGGGGGLTTSHPMAPLAIAATPYYPPAPTSKPESLANVQFCPGVAPLPTATVRTLVSQPPQSPSMPSAGSSWPMYPNYMYPPMMVNAHPAPPPLVPNYRYPVPPPSSVMPPKPASDTVNPVSPK